MAFDYTSVFRSPKTIISLGNAPRDINIFLPVRGRLNFLRPCLNYIQRAALEVGIKASIVVIENDAVPQYKNFCTQEGVDYIFIPNSISCSGGCFAKALCYNVGFMVVQKTEWNIFHDLDILIDRDFFKKLKTYLSDNTTWVQPYTKKRVLRLDPSETHKIVMNPHILFGLEGMGTPSNPGSPGGSIVVKSSDFINVGGYDPEVFYGYSPEDSFFWAKLEVLHKQIDKVFETHFQGSAIYADDPAIEVYHLDHQNTQGSNPNYMLMLRYLRIYFTLPYSDKRKIVDLCRDNFISAISNVGIY